MHQQSHSSIARAEKESAATMAHAKHFALADRNRTTAAARRRLALAARACEACAETCESCCELLPASCAFHAAARSTGADG
eukprot:4072944-Pleurochrysis_carterae.AAC.1